MISKSIPCLCDIWRPSHELPGLRALITGGASGLGLATARLLAGQGARVAVLDLQPEVPEPLIGIAADIADDVRAAVIDAADRLGGLDILINNAGITPSVITDSLEHPMPEGDS